MRELQDGQLVTALQLVESGSHVDTATSVSTDYLTYVLEVNPEPYFILKMC
ncbi:hypothetical protein ES703_121338 [subsurface metagenome]